MKNNNEYYTNEKEELIALYRQAMRHGLPLDEVEEKVNKFIVKNDVVAKKYDQQSDRLKAKKWSRKQVMTMFFPMAMICFGLYLLFSSLIPYADYLFFQLPSIRSEFLKTPVPREYVMNVNPIAYAKGSEVHQADLSVQVNKPIVIDTDLDYTKLSNWFDHEVKFEQKELEESEQSLAQTYILDIPKLKITNALVRVGTDDLSESLIQYQGTSDPGDAGSPVIFGHSMLRRYYNPSERNKNRYKSIFSTVMTLEIGDPIYVTKDNITYTYIVSGKTEVKPTDTYILDQDYNVRQLKLVTCVPEGTYLRRGVITAQLVLN